MEIVVRTLRVQVGADDTMLPAFSVQVIKSLELRVWSHNHGHECAASYCTVV